MAGLLARRLKTLVRHFLSSAVYPWFRSGIVQKCVFENGRAEIVQVEHGGRAYRFLSADRNDLIQSIHCGGALYEEEELEIIRDHFDAPEVFVDVGANVGNHAMFAAGALAARRVIAFEPFRGNIGRHRPKIFIEVSPHSADVFAAWVREHGYRISQRFRRYETVENFMLVPES